MIAAAIVCTSGCGRSAAPAVQATRQTFGWVDGERLARNDPSQWLTTGNDINRSHYSALHQIDRSNARRLGFAWEYKTGTRRGLEATPIVVDGVVYASGEFGRVFALDARTGKELWTFDPKVDGQALRKACCDDVNRGVAVWKGKVYVGALDGRLIALDAANGQVVWQADTFIDKTRGYTITGAPEIAGHVVVIGNGGADFDARGYVSAWDLETGEFRWRFFTVPGDPVKGFEHPELEMAAKTWDPKSRWDVGLGGTAWDAMVYDPGLNLLYVGTGNAALYNPAKRSPSGGNNLFLTSILAINPDSGRLVWYFQETPADAFDFTATQPIILADIEIDGSPRKVLMQAPKNGFFYLLDRQTGKFISARNFVPQTWAKRIDPDTGEATLNRNTSDYSRGPKLIFPSSFGAHSWHPMAYSARSRLVYIPVLEAGNFLFDPHPDHEYRPGLDNSGIERAFPNPGITAAHMPAPVAAAIRRGEFKRGYPDPAQRSYLRAWDPVRQQTGWSFETGGPDDRAGVLATGGGIVVSGSTKGKLRVFNDETGEVLQEMDVGSSIVAAPATYSIDGVQYIVVMAAVGGGAWTYAPPPWTAAYKYGNAGRILAFKLDGGATPLPPPLPPLAPFPEPPAQTASVKTVARGRELFHANCFTCHFNMPNGYPPDLRRLDHAKHEVFPKIVLEGLLRANGMPQWDDVLSPADVDAIHAYIISISWDAFRAEQKHAPAPVSMQPSNVQ